MKTCSTCGVEKDDSEYHRKTRKCKDCTKVAQKAYYAANCEARKAKVREYAAANRDKVNAAKRRYYEENADALKDKAAKWYAENTVRAKAANKEWREKNADKLAAERAANKDKINAYNKRYYAENREKEAKRRAVYNRKNRKRLTAQQAAYTRSRCASDPLYAFMIKMRKVACRALKGYGKDTQTERLLGMPFTDFHAIWESRCEHAGLTLTDAVIDHIVPLAVAETKTEAELLSHWTNLQPLTAEENAVKSDSMTPAIEQRWIELRAAAWLIDALNENLSSRI